MSKKCRRVCQNCILFVHRAVWNVYSGEIIVFFNIVGHWVIFSWSVVQKFPAKLWKMHSVCPLDHFDDKYSFWKKNIALPFSHVKRKCFEHLLDKIRCGCRNCIPLVQRNNVTNFYFKNYIFFIILGAIFFGDFPKSVKRICEKCILCVQMINLTISITSKNKE